MTSASSSAPCEVANCRNDASGRSQLYDRNMCIEHLNRERIKAEEIKTNYLRELQPICKESCELETEIEWLGTEKEDVNAAFDKLMNQIDHWRREVLAHLQKKQDSVVAVKMDVKKAENNRNLVEDAGDDLRKVVKHAYEEETWLNDAKERLENFSRERNSRHCRLIGDAAAGVQQLQVKIDRHMATLMRECRMEDTSVLPSLHIRDSFEPNNKNYLEPSKTIPVRDMPYYLAACTNTAGYVADPNTRQVHRGNLSGDLRNPLPEVCIFVAFTPKKKQRQLQVTSLKGDSHYEVHCDLINPEGKTTGLHCDSNQQQLYLAKTGSITIMDLSGQQIKLVDSNTLQRQVLFKKGITGRDQLMLVMDREAGAVLTIGFNNDGEAVVNRSTDISSLNPSDSKLRGLALHASKILFADYVHGKVHRVCGTSGSLISSIPSARNGNAINELKNPWQVAVDDRGLVIVSEFKGHTVRVMRPDGKILQTIGTGEIGNSEKHLSHPTGLAIAHADGISWLVVADTGNKRLHVFKML